VETSLSRGFPISKAARRGSVKGGALFSWFIYKLETSGDSRDMRRPWFILPSLFLAIPNFATGAPFAQKCPDIQTCARAVSEMLHQKYVFEADLNGKMSASPNVEIHRENAEQLFTHMLYLNGLTRVPLEGRADPEGTYQIRRIRDARDTRLPVLKADATHPPRLPEVWDLYELRYKATNPEVIEEISRSIRSFISAQSRIIPLSLSGELHVTAPAPELRKLYELIRDSDVKPTEEQKKKWSERDARIRAQAMAEAAGEAPGKLQPENTQAK